MRILYAEDEVEIQELCIMAIEDEIDCMIDAVENGQEAIDLLKNDSNYDLVLSDYNMPLKNGGDLYEFIQSEELNIPFILISSERPEDHIEFTGFREYHTKNTNFLKPFDLIELGNYIKNINEEVEDIKPTEYSKVRIKVFKLLNHTPVDIFVKISDEKFIKIIKANDEYEFSSINKYFEKGINYLYVKTNDFQSFFDSFTSKLHGQLKGSVKNISSEHQVQGISLIQNAIASVGINDSIVALADEVVESCVAEINQDKKLSKLLDELILNSEDRYCYSLLTSYISTSILKQVDWSSNEVLKKVSMASLLMDISLQEDNLTKVRSLNGEEKSSLSKNEIEAVKSHPRASVEIFCKNYKIANEIEDIVLCHHERPDGRGFPRGKEAGNISQVSAAFILACEVAHICLSKKVNLHEAINTLDDSYSKGCFKNSYKALCKNC